MKVSFLLSIALGICTIVASAVLWMVMDAMGVFSTVGGTISEATGSNESNGFDLQSFLSLPNVLLFATVIAVVDVVLATALATLGAFIYNLSAGFVGGVELTLAEDEDRRSPVSRQPILGLPASCANLQESARKGHTPQSAAGL